MRISRERERGLTPHDREEGACCRGGSGGRRPAVLFITCTDFGMDPARVMQNRAGALFVFRNVGNIIPPYHAGATNASAAAALEYAVRVLKVSAIIVCGHSNCEAMEALRNESVLYRTMPHLSEWLRIADPVRRLMARHYRETPDDLKHRIMEKENVLFQIGNIETYPFVEEALEAGTLRLQGWYYDGSAGRLTAYNPASDLFESIPDEDQAE